jgi:hypothetical protein
MHDDVFILFHRALHMPSKVEVSLTWNYEFYSQILSGVLIYNMGLAHHLAGIQNGNSWVLSSALEFYLMAYSTIRGQIKFLRGKYNGLNLGLMAISNNAGHIYAHSRSFTEAGICNDELSACLATVLSSHTNGIPSLSDEEYKVFFLNICFFKESWLGSAPAA